MVDRVHILREYDISPQIMTVSLGKVTEDGSPSAPTSTRRTAMLGAGGLLLWLSLLLASPHFTTGITRDSPPPRKMGGIPRGGIHNKDEGAGIGGAPSDARLLDNVYPSPAMSGRCWKGYGCFSHRKVLQVQGRRVIGQAEQSWC